MILKEVLQFLRDPVDATKFHRIEDDAIYFEGGNSYPVADDVPILVNESNSLFTIREIVRKSPTTQSREYRDRSRVKNYVRQRVLPVLSKDWGAVARYQELEQRVANENVLVIGAGDKVEFYKRCFENARVISSDIHNQFGVDIVFDAHDIPFVDNSFSLVLLPQVLEHTARPWDVAKEIQRVVRNSGVIHIEVPFGFPWHGAPYDFYRFTPSALRLLFPRCQMEKIVTPEGSWSTVAIAGSSALVTAFSNRYMRMIALMVSRFSLFWLKYLDRLALNPHLDFPKGFIVTYRHDGIERTEKQMLHELQLVRPTGNRK